MRSWAHSTACRRATISTNFLNSGLTAVIDYTGGDGNDVAIDVSAPAAPSLGMYPDTSVTLSGDTTIEPSATPTDATAINVSTVAGFNGHLAADLVSGDIRVTNAYPANIPPGSYPVTVKAFGPGGMASTTFMLTVTDGMACLKHHRLYNRSRFRRQPPYALEVGDFDNDGNHDLATVNNGSNTVSIRLGDGMGGFTVAPDVATGSNPVAVSIGDFNNDGKQDIAIANAGPDTISIRLGDGLGNFTGTTDVPVGSNPSYSAVGDFNNDGKRDIAVANNGSATVSIRLGDGLGGFTDDECSSRQRSGHGSDRRF